MDPDTVRKVRVGESVYVLAPQYVGLERDVAIKSKKEMSCVTAAKLTLLLMLINVLFVIFSNFVRFAHLSNNYDHHCQNLIFDSLRRYQDLGPVRHRL